MTAMSIDESEYYAIPECAYRRDENKAEVKEVSGVAKQETRDRYSVIMDYGSDGWQWMDGEFGTVDEAVKRAVTTTYGHYGHEFVVVKVIEWEAREVDSE
jgi:hypothetical protein